MPSPGSVRLKQHVAAGCSFFRWRCNSGFTATPVITSRAAALAFLGSCGASCLEAASNARSLSAAAEPVADALAAGMARFLDLCRPSDCFEGSKGERNEKRDSEEEIRG
mmetsp:Transcript_40903/g.97514  ORF Transcript_40903/g.97514 Transcript_40903/m.97514 type:complete len:109 (+) Transcript_40903:319-645(+)